MTPIDEATLNEAAGIIRAGGLVAMPTETVYGLAADATSDTAVARIFEAKGRPRFNPLIIHVSGEEMAKSLTVFSPLAEKLAAAFWPGALTMVLPRRADCGLSLLASAGLDTVAVRAPGHNVAQALISRAGRPVAAPSANRSGMVSPTEAVHVRESLGDVVNLILDGGRCDVGVESTIVKLDGDDVILLRPGGVARGAIEEVLGRKLADAPHETSPQAPGMLKSHYAPTTPLRMNADAPEPNEAWLGFGPDKHTEYSLNLSPQADLREAAANLFHHMRALDALAQSKGLAGIAVAPVPKEGLGEAINDRLTRAAAAS